MIKKILFIILVICSIIACSQKKESKEILFVCTHGAARSPIAAAYFNKLAKEKDLNYHAVFRGTEPDQVLTEGTIDGLTKDGFEINNWKPVGVSAQDIEKAHKVITFDCTIPSEKKLNLKEEWNGTPSISKDYDVARNAIKKKVEQLVETFKKEK